MNDHKTIHYNQRLHRKSRASLGWWNWYHNRNRLDGINRLDPGFASLRQLDRELRMVSWRRCL